MTIQVNFSARPMNLDAIVADRAAFRDWYDEALPRVYRYLFARCGHDAALAEELTQQTFVEALRRRSSFDGRSDVVTWLCAIGRNKLVDHYRRTTREQRRHLRLVGEWTESEADLWSRRDVGAQVQAGLAELPGEQRLVLILRYLDQLPVREIAVSIGRSEKATESLLSRAREAFRRVYGATD